MTNNSDQSLGERILLNAPYTAARILGGLLALSFITPPEDLFTMSSEEELHFSWILSWLHRFDPGISMWFFWEFLNRMWGFSWNQDQGHYSRGVLATLNLLAAIPPTMILPIEAVRHLSRFLMGASTEVFRTAIQIVLYALIRVVKVNKEALSNAMAFTAFVSIATAIMIAVVEPNMRFPALWTVDTIFPFIELPAIFSFSPTTISGNVLQAFLTLFGYALLAWLGILVLRTWKIAVGDPESED